MKIQTKLLHPHPRNSEFFDDITGEPWQEFLKSVETSGVIQPVVITQDNVVVSGHQRLRACQELGIAEIPVVQRTYANEDAVLKDLLETNIRQRGVDNSNPVKLGRCIRELDRIYGIQSGGNHGNQHTTKEKLPEAHNELLPKTQAELAEQLGIPFSTYKRYKQLASLIPEWEEFLETGVITPTTALGVVRQLASDDQREFLSRLDKETKYSASMTQPLVDEIKQLKSAPPKVVKDEETARKLSEATRQHAEDARVIKGLRSSEDAQRRRADAAERKLSDSQAQVDDLQRQLEERDRRLAEKESEEHTPLDYFVYTLDNNDEDAQELVDMAYEVQKILETKLAPLKFKRCMFDIADKSGNRKVITDLVDRVDLWVNEMRDMLNTDNAKVIDL